MLALWLALSGAGCGSSVDDPPIAPETPAGAEAPAAVEAPLAAGAYWIDSSERGVSLRAAGASLLEVLESLGRALGFQVAAGPQVAERRVSLELQEEPIEVVLARLLDGMAYTLSYRADAEATRSVLHQLRVGASDTARAQGRSRDQSRSREERRLARAERRERRKAEDPGERKLAAARQREQLRAERLAREAETLAALESSDPSLREAAVRDLDPEAGYPRAVDLLRNDPDPAVRAAALDRVFQSNAAASLPELVRATRDSDPQVVIEALDYLDFEGDASLLPELEHLREHPDPQVREKYAETSDLLSE